jgi:uroporphyrinogen-III synthase
VSQLREVSNVVQRPREPRRRWFASETLDLLIWVSDAGDPLGFQLSWHDGGKGHALTSRLGEPLAYERVDEGSRGGAGYARSATLHTAIEDYDIALIQPRFAAVSAELPAGFRAYVLRELGLPESTPVAAAKPLDRQVVLVTRPLRQARQLVGLLEAAGAQPRLLPMLAIRPPELADIAIAAQQLHTHRRAAAWIFTSANAVSAAQQMFDPGHWHAPMFAVGEATAKALAALGHVARRPPADAIHSEGLLSLPELQVVADREVLIVTGEGGRDGLREPLISRGAKVHVATVYRRVVVPHLPETVAATLDGVTALMVTSGESLVALHKALVQATAQNAGAPAATTLPVVVPSRRVLAMARGLGFIDPRQPATVSDEAFVQALMDRRAA